MKKQISTRRLLTPLLVLTALLPAASSLTFAEGRTVEVVKLYSNGKLVEQRKAISKGRMQGPCYVFKVRKNARTPQVRFCGTFSVEEVR